MTVSASPEPPKPKSEFDPDDYRMSVGEHLEELRSRLILALVGFVVALVVCLFFGTTVISVFCKPLIVVLRDRNLNTQLTSLSPGDTFGVWIQISLICAAAVASPWILYQLWQFVAAGLYPNERKCVTKYIPLSISLLIGGMLFVYFFVLPWTLLFFVDFTGDIPLPADFRQASHPATTQPVESAFPVAPVLDGDKVNPNPGQFWFNAAESRLKIYLAPDDVRVITFGSKNLIASMYTLPEYIDLVLGMLIAFGLSFQMPLVVLALAQIGVIAAAVITPGSDIPSLVGLTIPLILLYELGLWLAANARKRAATASP
jgi:sec-independent protein translocase protein TatC